MYINWALFIYLMKESVNLERSLVGRSTSWNEYARESSQLQICADIFYGRVKKNPKSLLDEK